jgi:predicted nucleic acid-binding protein
VDLRCWDSSCWSAHLGREPGRVDRTRSVINAAESGDLRIVTSALALIEVIKLKSREPLPPEKEPTIRAFFKQPYIIIREVDRRVGELARDLIWTHRIPVKDAVHVATALLTEGVVQLDIFDEDDLIKHSRKLGEPPLVIGFPPLIPEQLELGSDGEEEAGTEA